MARQLLAAVVCSTAAAFAPIVSTVAPLAAAPALAPVPAEALQTASNVLICGLDGVGVEIAKNVILAGVRSVTLLDDTPASWMDLGAQFYVTEADLDRATDEIAAGEAVCGEVCCWDSDAEGVREKQRIKGLMIS